MTGTGSRQDGARARGNGAAGPLPAGRRPAAAAAKRAAGTALALALALTLGTAPAEADEAPLTAAEARGRTVYREGRSPSGGTVTAVVGGTLLPGEAVPCLGCHGTDGRGRPEGGLEPPEITWEQLTRPHGHRHPGGRQHPAFDEAAAVRAIAGGVDPAGNPLAAAMPRYSMARADLLDLVAYLRRLSAELDPGLTRDTIRIGTALPTNGPLAALAGDVRALLEAEFAERNRRGGVHGRNLALVVAEYDATRERGPERLAELHRRQPLFAVIAGVIPGDEAALAEFAAREELPWLGPLTHHEPPGGGGWVFRPTAGLAEEVRVLIRHAARELPVGERSGVVVVPREPGPEAAARAALAEAHRAGVALELRSYEPGRFDPALAGEREKRDIDFVLFLGGDDELAAWAARVRAHGRAPRLLVPGSGAVRAASALPAAGGQVRLAFPAVPSAERPGAVAALARLSPAFRSGRHRAALVSVHASVAVLVEGLGCAGRHLARARLVTCLEEIQDLETGLLPPIGFGTGRRVGIRGAYVVEPDPAARTFRPVGGFLRLLD